MSVVRNMLALGNVSSEVPQASFLELRLIFVFAKDLSSSMEKNRILQTYSTKRRRNSGSRSKLPNLMQFKLYATEGKKLSDQRQRFRCHFATKRYQRGRSSRILGLFLTTNYPGLEKNNVVPR